MYEWKEEKRESRKERRDISEVDLVISRVAWQSKYSSVDYYSVLI